MNRDLLLVQPSSGVTDPDAEYVSLLLNGDGTNGAQNNTFIDSSVNNATITRYGDTTQGSFSPFGNSWGNYFGGDGYLMLANSTPLTLTNVDYTLEAWVLPLNYSQYSGIIAKRGDSGREYQLWLDYSTGYLSCSSSAGTNYYSARVVPLGTWSHIAVVYTHSNTTAKLFHNGELVHTIANFDNTVTRAESVRVGSATTGQSITGYISNARIVKGTAVYTSNFTPSTTPLTAITNTVLLTCQSNNFKDNSVNNATITTYGNTKVVKDSPFPEIYDKAIQGASVYFDGTGDWLLSAPLSSNALGAGDFTVECWVNVPTISGGYAAIVADNEYSNSAGGWAVYANGATIEIWIGAGTSLHTISSALTSNTWIHIAWVRVGTSSKVYINGVASSSVANSTAYAGTRYWVGARGPTTGVYPFTGYISNLRIIKGTALYTSNFTPSTTPLTAITGTSLLLNCDNAGIVDATGKNDLVTYGNAQISTTQKKFGTGSMSFNGTNQWLRVPASGLAPATNDYTLEFWVYPNSISGEQELAIFDTTGSLGIGLNGGYPFIGRRATAIDLTSSTAITSGVWYHLAFTRYNGTARIFINGVQTASASLPFNYTDGPLDINGYGNGSGAFISCYIDDYRYTKGIARYPLNIMPTKALPLPTATAAGDDPYWASVSLLLNGDSLVDKSSSPNTVTAYGDAQVSTAVKKFGAGSMYTGTGYIASPYNSALEMRTGDFTVEFWLYVTSWVSFVQHVSLRTSNASAMWGIDSRADGSIYVHSSDYIATSSAGHTTNAWNHICAVRISGVFKIYVNGVLEGTSTNTILSQADFIAPSGIAIGAGVNGGQQGAAYIDDLRITKGVARYTANFTPPTQSLPLSGGNPLDPYSAHVSLFLTGDGANGSTTFTDLSLSPNTVTAYGNAQISTTQKKFRTGSMSFDGTGDYLSLPSSSVLNFGTGDFTVDMWINVISVDSQYPILISCSSPNNYFGISKVTTNTYKFANNFISSSPYSESPAVMNTGTWYFISIVRNSNTLSFYINGTLDSSVTQTGSLGGTTEVTIGYSSNYASTYYFNGYIDDLRITKGVARYTANFTPPTKSLSL